MRTMEEILCIDRVENGKTTISPVKKFLISLFLLHCCFVVVSAGPISFGETVSGTISTPGNSDSYTFDATSGDTIYIHMTAGWAFNPITRVYYGGSLVNEFQVVGTGFWNETTFAAPTTGTYTLLFGDKEGGDTGTYTLYLQRLNNPTEPHTLRFGQTHTDFINMSSEKDTYNFTATAGDTIYIHMTAGWAFNPITRVYYGGSLVNEFQVVGTGFWNETTFAAPTTGTYTLLFGDKEGGDTGTYTLYLQRLNNPTEPHTLRFGQTHTDFINMSSEKDTYNFTATAGDTIYIHMTAGWAFNPITRVYYGGSLVNEFQVVGTGFWNETTFAAPTTGTYTLLFGDKEGGDTGTYTLYLQRLNNPGYPPAANFTASVTSGGPPLIVTFNDTSTNSPTVWNWSFGDGNYSSLQHPVHTYGFPGLFTMTLFVSNNDGDDTITRDNYIEVTNFRKSMISVFRPSTRQFIFNTAPVTRTTFGLGTDIPITGDWDGDDITDVGVFRPSTRQFIFNTAPVTRTTFGLSTDIPITGDWNGDHITDVGVFRPSVRQFIFNTAPVTRTTFGLSTDIPITGDWNGDHITDIGVFRPSARQFIFNTTPITRITFGMSTDISITGDWNGDGTTDSGVFRPSARQFIFNTAPITRTTFGLSTDIPITGSWE